MTIIVSDDGLSLGRHQAHYRKQCWNIVNWTLRNKLQWNLNRNSYIFIHENAFENVVWKMAAILSRPQCVNTIMCQQHNESCAVIGIICNGTISCYTLHFSSIITQYILCCTRMIIPKVGLISDFELPKTLHSSASWESYELSHEC